MQKELEKETLQDKEVLYIKLKWKLLNLLAQGETRSTQVT